MLEFENAKNPFLEKRDTILAFMRFASEIISPNQEIEETAGAIGGICSLRLAIYLGK